METNNKVELIGYYGSDEVIACSAWTSTSRELSVEELPGNPFQHTIAAWRGNNTIN